MNSHPLFVLLNVNKSFLRNLKLAPRYNVWRVLVVFKFPGGKMKTAQLGSTGTQNKSKPKKPYDKPSQKPTKSIGANVFTNYPQPLIGKKIIQQCRLLSLSLGCFHPS